jgi:hypothetical protein
MKKEITSLRNERDDLQLQLRRVEDTINTLSPSISDNTALAPESSHLSRLEQKVKSDSRKLTIYEVNQSILSRRYHTLHEQSLHEHQVRREVENDFIEMEGVLKRRIVFLEQYKAQMRGKLEQYQRELGMSVPQSDYLMIQNELERLREDYLYSLRRELEARITSLNSLEKEREGMW